jgi:hypothetical protein
MRNVFSILATLAWALWLGGLVAVFLIPTVLFKRDHDLAMQANPVIFHFFERYQLILAAAALIFTVLWRAAGGSVLVTAVFVLLALSTISAIAAPLVVTPKLERLTAAGQTRTPQFRRLHGYSMMLYCATGGGLLIAGIILPLALRRPGPPPPEKSGHVPGNGDKVPDQGP